MNALLNSPLLLGLRTFLTPIEAAEALSGTGASNSRLNPILEASWPLLSKDEPLAKERAQAIDQFRRVDPDHWKAVLKPDRQAAASNLALFQPDSWFMQDYIEGIKKRETRERKEGERWIYYSPSILFNPESGEVLQTSKLRGKRLGSIVDPNTLPTTIDVFLAKRAPYIFSTNPLFQKLAYGVQFLTRDKGLVLNYQGEQYDAGEFCVTGALMLHNANAPERSGLPEDYRIVSPHDLIDSYEVGPFIPAVRTRQTLSPDRHLARPKHPAETLRELFEGRSKRPSPIFEKGSPVVLLKPETVNGRKQFYARKGKEMFLLSAPEEFCSLKLDVLSQDLSTPTMGMIIQALESIPDTLLKGLNRIEIWDEYGPNHASANAGSGVIKFFKQSNPVDALMMFKETEASLYHELGHHLALYLFGDFYMKNHCGWLKAMQADGNSPSRYAQKNRAEDFAETMLLYFLTQGGLSGDARQRHPNRFAFLDELFWDVLKPSARKKIRALKK